VDFLCAMVDRERWMLRDVGEEEGEIARRRVLLHIEDVEVLVVAVVVLSEHDANAA